MTKRLLVALLACMGIAAGVWLRPNQPEKPQTFIRQFEKMGTLKATVTVQFPRPWASENEIANGIRAAEQLQAGKVRTGRIEVGDNVRVYKPAQSEAEVTISYREAFPSDDALCAALQHAAQKNAKVAERSAHIPTGWDTADAIAPWLLGLLVLVALVFAALSALFGGGPRGETPDQAHARAISHKRAEISLARDYIKMLKGE